MQTLESRDEARTARTSRGADVNAGSHLAVRGAESARGRKEDACAFVQLLGVVTAGILAFGLSTVPVQATVHEIVAQWCSGHDELLPPGITRPGSKNFAQPLNAARIIVTVVDEDEETITITFAYDHPAMKVRSTGQTIPIGVDPETGFTLLLDVIEPDPNFPAFQHCPALGF